jgi:hypothetical protein
MHVNLRKSFQQSAISRQQRAGPCLTDVDRFWVGLNIHFKKVIVIVSAENVDYLFQVIHIPAFLLMIVQS